ncbi:MAG TPA: galactose oxidase early set domain-containing protein [Nocardioidaceae bacterium]|nr:galactose oxidase early set domain-containing protein [Nocardioidaceae bacterium]
MSSLQRRTPLRRRARNYALVSVGIAVMAVANGPVVSGAATTAYTDYRHSRPAYMKAHGHWDTVDLPEGFRARAVHSALLHTGDVLLIAGSGNSQSNFDAGTFKTVLWNPVTGEAKNVATPEDLFCGGHAYLPNGNLLVAGGTKKYEVLADDVKEAAGVLTMRNESSNGPVTLEKGTRFTGPGGLKYRSTEKVVVPPAHQMDDYSLMAGAADVWIRAEEDSKKYVTTGGKRFTVTGDIADESKNLFGTADSITFKKQDYRGLDSSYIYDVEQEKYVATGRLTMPRWYPTLVSMNGGNVMAVSGLDDHGQIIQGNNEVYERSARKWYDKPGMHRYFPTYPQLFRLADGRFFYSGANTGYGSATEGRQPGIWNTRTNAFRPVKGLRDADQNETATSFLLPPAQRQKVAMVGGGGIGDSSRSTARFDVADLSKKRPMYTPGMDLPHAARYLNAVTLPNDTVLVTGGSSNYRGKQQSDLHSSSLYHADTGMLTRAAPNEVGRNYHSTALLLPDGRVMTMGADPLFSDEDDTMPGSFETRVEVYTPPYLYTGTPRPVLTSAPRVVERGTTFGVSATSASPVVKARLMRPSAVTHQTDVEQRSVALDITRDCPQGGTSKAECHCEPGSPSETGCRLDLTLGKREGITPSGRYMLILVDSRGVPSEASWVRVK